MNLPGSAHDLPVSQSAPVQPGIGEVWVWHTSLEVQAQRMPELEAVLSADERARAGRFVFERDRISFVAARAALRSILAQCTGADAASIRFAYGTTGKPELAGAPGMRFNLSHSGSLAVIAVTRERAIGVDVEYMGREVDYESIARTFFSVGERAQLAALTPDLRRHGFFNCWTRKEAFLKATGEGISNRYAGFEVSLAPGEAARVLRIEDDPGAAARWGIHAFEPAPGYVAAAVFEGECTRLTSLAW